MDKQEKKQISFGISTIKTKALYINEIDLLKSDNIQFSVGINLNGDKHSQEVNVEISAQFQKGGDKPLKFLELTSVISYKIDNFDDVVVVDEDTISMPEPFTITLVSIAISTARGILAAKTEGTNLSKFIIPILDPKKVIAEGKVIN